MSSLLDSFKPKKLVIGSPYLTVTNNGISLNKSAIDKLEYTEYVRILVDEENKMLAIQICSADDPNREAFVKPSKKGKAQYVRWNNREFVKQLLPWAPTQELRDNGFKIPGKYLADDKAFLFIFNEAISV